MKLLSKAAYSCKFTKRFLFYIYNKEKIAINMDLIQSAKNILIIYEEIENLKNFTDNLQDKTKGEISAKSVEELLKNESPSSVFDLVLSGFSTPNGIIHTNSLLLSILRVLKPDGTIALRQIVGISAMLSHEQFISELKISGFVKISEHKKTVLSNEEIDAIKKKLNTEDKINVIELSCSKPNYEIGSSTVLSFAKKKADATAVWKLDSDEDNSEYIDPDTLLDEDDLKKPDPSSLRVCGTTGKRKACKDCSCGLADELEAEVTVKAISANPLPKSSCGSCYLGDAFRCASCPYLGMPAFKPGEKIQLGADQLQPDL